ncbi:MAG: hypothetical protein ACR2QR_07380 [Woeseiaceae bacterium]
MAINSHISKATVLAAFLVWPVVSTAGQQEDDVTNVPPLTESTADPSMITINPTEPHMSESLRADIGKLVVVAGTSPAGDSVTGSYETETAGLFGGMEEGSRIGTISKEIGGVPVNIPIPVIGTLGSIYGGISGAAKREIQDFRDALTDELVNADSPPLRSDGLALDAFWAIRRLPTIDSHLFAAETPVPEDTDAILYVDFAGITIDVQKDDAIITTTANAMLLRRSDNRNIYQAEIHYQDRDSLSNWTKDDNKLWREYTNFARYYLGREVAADVFGRVVLNHELAPLETETASQAKKDERKLVSQTPAPTLAWDLALHGADAYGPWTEMLDESRIAWDIAIFDNRELVYYEKQLADSPHMLYYELEPCKTYRWSVRPVYNTGTAVKFGEWMRYPAEVDEESGVEKGLVGREASLAPALTQDFPVLEIECPRR